MSFEVGTTCYTRRGKKVEVVAITADGQYVVSPFLRDMDDEEYVADIASVESELFEKAPTTVLDERIARLKNELANLEKQTTAAREVCFETERQAQKTPEILTRLKRFPALERLEDFIEGRITHVVTTSWDDVTLLPLKSLEADQREKGIPLITLFGDSKGDIAWKVSPYRDGSGSWRGIFLHTSEAEAVEKRSALLVEMARDAIKDARRDRLVELANNAAKYGVTLPDDVSREAARAKQAKADKEREDLTTRLRDIERRLQELGATTADAA